LISASRTGDNGGSGGNGLTRRNEGTKTIGVYKRIYERAPRIKTHVEWVRAGRLIEPGRAARTTRRVSLSAVPFPHRFGRLTCVTHLSESSAEEDSISGWTTSGRHTKIDASERHAFDRRTARGEDVRLPVATWPRCHHTSDGPARRALSRRLFSPRVGGPSAPRHQAAASRALPLRPRPTATTASLPW
jgi:hypothetical protein